MKSKTKNKTDAKRPIVLIGTQNKKNSNLILSIIVKLLLTYMLCVGTLMCFACFYNIPYELGQAVQHTLLYVTPLFPVFLIVKKRYIIPCILVFCVICYYFLHEPINEAVLIFKDQLLLSLDGRLLQTAQFVPKDSLAFLTKTEEYITGMNTAMTVFSGVVCLATIFFTHKKFSGIGTIVMWLLLYIPSFISEKADYTPYTLLIVPAFFALYAFSTSNLAEEERLLAKRKKRAKKEKPQKANISTVEAVINELSQHSRNCLCGILAGVVAFIAFFTTQSFFPGFATLDIKEVVNTVTEFFSDAGNYIDSIFSGEGSSPFNNYFSNDNFFLNNDIEIKAPPALSEKPVLNIKSDKPDPFCLIGDVGVEYTGNGWVSVMKKEKSGELSYDGYNIDESFNPDLLYQIYITYLISPATESDNNTGQMTKFTFNDNAFAIEHLNDYHTSAMQNNKLHHILREIASYSHLSIEYLQNTDIVFKPYIPGNTSYVSNGSFVTYADSIIRISDKKNWMKTFETDVISPDYSLWFASTVSQDVTSDEVWTKRALQSLGFSDKEANAYKNSKLEYDRYIKDNYTHVPDSEKENMKRLLSEFEGAYTISPSTINSDYMYAFALCEYLKSEYKYSLTASNMSDGEQTVLGSFLFNTKEGHCALYATSMVLALREHGIPARYVSGFSTGNLTLNEKSGFYEKTIKEKDLHAWVEVYFPELGWMAFDPTGQSDDSDSPAITPPETSNTTPPTTSHPVTTPPVTTTTNGSSQTTPPQTTTGQSGDSGDGPGAQKDGESGLLLIIVTAALIVLAVGAGIYGTIFFVNNKNTARWKRFATADCTKSAKEMHELIMKLFTVTDITPELSELPAEFAVRVDALMNISNKRNNLQDIMAIIEKAEFSASGISEEERKRVYIYTKMLYDLVMKSAGKLKKLYLKIIL
ncbi:MAG: transglutaminase domain-containing protein [Ruminiclostridium sp.]|nr:transglutaminase domain-containing protein [Ruminiclostridium sp.]